MSWDANIVEDVHGASLTLTCKVGYIDVIITEAENAGEYSVHSVLLNDPDGLQTFQAAVNRMVDAAMRHYDIGQAP